MRSPCARSARWASHSGAARSGYDVKPHERPAPILPEYWSPQQALAVFECLDALTENLWASYGPRTQHAWREQLVHERPAPPIGPDEPF